jgi:hypothetical protein
LIINPDGKKRLLAVITKRRDGPGLAASS